MWRIIIADTDMHNVKEITDFYKSDKSVQIVNSVASFDFLLSEIIEYQLDAVFIDYLLIKDNYEKCCNAITNIPNPPKVIILANSTMDNKQIGTLCERFFVLCKPFSPDAIKRTLKVLLSSFKRNNSELLVNISRMLGNIGVQTHLDGYKYIRDAITIFIVNDGNIPIGEIYVQLAERYKKNTHCIERSIRNAIESAWVNGNVDYINSLFGFTVKEDSGKPSNREFIAMVSDKFISNISFK